MHKGEGSESKYSAKKSEKSQFQNSSVISTKSDEIKDKLYVVFKFYASFGDRINTKALKSNKFHKLMADAAIRSDLLSATQLDIFFVQVCQKEKSLSFEKFVELLPKISFELFPSLSKKEALKKLLKEHLIPLFENIMNETDLGEDEIRLKEPIEIPCLIALKILYPTLNLLYQAYFESEKRPNDSVNSSEMQLNQFLKDFDVCPNFVTKSFVHLLFVELLNSSIQELTRSEYSIYEFIDKDFGNNFTFSRFSIFLIRCSFMAFPSEDSNHLEKFALLLERMEYSPGFQNVEKRTYRTHSSNYTLLLPEEFLKEVGAQFSQNNSQVINEPLKSKTLENSKSKEPQESVMDNYTMMLSRVFDLISCGENNSKFISGPRFAKFMKELGFSLVDIDIVFSRFSFHNKLNNVTFEKAIRHLFDEHELDLNVFSSFIEGSQMPNSREEFSEENVKVLLEITSKHISQVGRYYAESNGGQYLDSKGFARFCRDFGIFPDVVPQKKVFDVYKELTNDSKENFLKLEDLSKAIAIIAFDAYYSETDISSFEKICFLLEKMNQSEGPVIVQKGIGATR